jgi:hypothetical protein
MPLIEIVAPGLSQQERNQARGKLFETLSAEILRHLGYVIDSKPNVNYAGMEIDIVGRHNATGIPLYAECKCYSNDVAAPKFQAFFGKYMSMWLEDKRAHGIFLALPGLNSHVEGVLQLKLWP